MSAEFTPLLNNGSTNDNSESENESRSRSSSNTDHVIVCIETVPGESNEVETITAAINTLPTLNSSVGIANTELDLHDGKEAHLFVSYCSDDKWRVIPMIENLEKEYGVVCLFDERNFQPGMEIHENIERAMDKSMKVLCFLSENFVKSSFCKYEKNLAFIMSMESESNTVIPVLLEECEIPSTMKTLTYIDVTRSDSDFYTKVVEALRMKDTSDGIETGRIPQTIENGYYIDIISEKGGGVWCPRPPLEEAYLDHYTWQAIQNANFTIPIETFQRAIGIVNTFRMRKRWSRYHLCMRIGLCCYLNVLFGISLPLLYALFGLIIFRRSISNDSADFEQRYPIYVAISILVVFVVTIMVIPLYRYIQKRDMKKMADRVFHEITLETYKQGALFQVIFRETKCNTYTILRVTRYNVHPCLKFLAKQVKKRVEDKLNKDVDSCELFDTFADDFLRTELRQLISNPPEAAPIVRHSVRGGKACFCQRIESFIKERDISELCEKYFRSEFVLDSD